MALKKRKTPGISEEEQAYILDEDSYIIAGVPDKKGLWCKQGKYIILAFKSGELYKIELYDQEKAIEIYNNF